MKPSAKTPLVQQRTSSLFGHAIIFVMVPWLMFVGTTGAYFTLYHLPYHEAAGLVAVGGIVCAELVFCALLLLSRKAWVRQLGQMAALVVCAGAVAGLWNEYSNMVYYHKYKALNEYSNVLPTASINTILDGGVLYFSTSTVIDTQKAAAFKSFTSPGKTFCVAPVLDDTYTPTLEVGVWAVGVNCCGERASFMCDDTDDASSKSGVVLLPAEDVLPEWAISLGLGANNFDDYLGAIKLAAAAFGTSVAAEVRMVHWIANPQDFINEFRTKAIRYWSDASTLVLGLLFASVVLLVLSGHQV